MRSPKGEDQLGGCREISCGPRANLRGRAGNRHDAATGTGAGFGVCRLVADHPRVSKVNSSLLRRPEQQPWGGLSAGAFASVRRNGPRRVVRAVVERIETDRRNAEKLAEPGLDADESLFREQASRNARLVGDHDEPIPGLLQQVFEGAPRDARIVVDGVCMETDRSEPMLGIMKELNVQYVLGYTPDEFAFALRLIAEGEVDAASLVTATVGIDGVAAAFNDLANPERHTKIIVEPWR